MAPAWLSVPHGALSLDRAPSIHFRPDQPASRGVPAVLRRPGTVAVSVAALRRPLVATVAAATNTAAAASVEERERTFIEEMRAVAMRLHSRDQSKYGEKEAPMEPPVAKWRPTVEGYLRFLVDSKLVFETLEAIVDSAAIPWCRRAAAILIKGSARRRNNLEKLHTAHCELSSLAEDAEFRSTGLERSEPLKKDLEWFRQQGHKIPEPCAPGITYASLLEELSVKEPYAFVCHFYNVYFAHSAGGRIIGKEVAEKIHLQKELEFYEWEGDLSQLQQNIRGKLNQVASGWSRAEKDRCLDEMEKAFACSIDLRRHMF